MLSEENVAEMLDALSHDDLVAWTDEGWVRPARHAGKRMYREIDIARVRLIIELKDDLNVRRENIPLFLSLIDQIHGLRCELRRVAEAIDAQPGEIRDKISEHLTR